MTRLVTFVCWGNICRSPMGEQIARHWARRAGIAASFDSAGVSAEESGNRIDRRAARVLAAHGYECGDHRAKQVTRRLLDASGLVLAFEPMHLQRLGSLTPETGKLRLITDFDPGSRPGSGIADPWYGDASDFEQTLTAIEAAMPGIIAAVADLEY